MKQIFTASNSRLLLLAVGFGVIVWQAATLLFTSAEAAAWYQFVRPRFAALLVTPGAWSGLFYGLLAKRSIGIFRLSEFSLRLPVILAGAVYLASFAKIPMSWRWWLLLPLAIVPVFMHCFSFAGGLGISLGACALALCHPKYAGVCLGFALAAAPQFGFVPGILAVAFLVTRGFWRGMERVVIPAVTLAFILLLIPLSHGGPPAPAAVPADAADLAIHSAVQILRQSAGSQAVRIAVSPAARPALEFYRERYRQRNWWLDAPDPQYYLWLGSAPSGAPNHPETVLFNQGGVVLFR
jgi:hypothetical protein